MIHVYIHYPNIKEAKRISKILLHKKLAACINFISQEDMYWWKGKIEETKGIISLVGTRQNNFNKIEKLVKKLHSYDVPCILELPINKSSKSYKEWLYEQTK